MKVLISTTVSGTINAFLVPYIKLFKQLGYRVHILARETIPYSDEVLSLVDCIHYVEMDRNVFSFKNVKSFFVIRRILKIENYDIINTHTPVVSTLIRILSLKVKSKIIYTAHGFHFSFPLSTMKDKLIFFIEQMNTLNTDSIITINQSDYELAKKFRSKRLKHNYQFDGVGYDFHKLYKSSSNELNIRKKFGFKNSDFILFYAAELNENKNQKLLLEIMTKFRDLNIKLILAGDGSEKMNLMNMISELNLSNKVSLLGRVDYISDILQEVDLVVASSRREGLPFNILEALAYDIPVVATDIRGHSDIIVHGNNGFLVPDFNVDSFSDYILQYYKKKQVGLPLLSCQKEYLKKYSVETAMNKMKLVINEFGKEE